MQTFVKVVLIGLGVLFVSGIVYEVIDRIRDGIKHVNDDDHHRS
ncbi:hypothetical protein [Burkholderia cenocepacia]|nr:hypothetical protein [Burkholderia cenocepacia]